MYNVFGLCNELTTFQLLKPTDKHVDLRAYIMRHYNIYVFDCKNNIIMLM